MEKQQTTNDCLLACFAHLANLSLELVATKIGQKEEYCITDLIHYFFEDYHITPLPPVEEPVITTSGTCSLLETLFITRIMHRFDCIYCYTEHYMEKGGHAQVWDHRNRVFIDPLTLTNCSSLSGELQAIILIEKRDHAESTLQKVDNSVQGAYPVPEIN